MNSRVGTSFKEGISKIDNGTEDDTTFAVSSSSLSWLDLEIAFGESK